MFDLLSGLIFDYTLRNVALGSAILGAVGGALGCFAILRRQGLLGGTWCIEPHETLSPGQSDDIDRVSRRYPFFGAEDDLLVRERLDEWLR